MKPLSVYFHIPYCEHKCIYCDFYSVINGKSQEEYFKALRTEIDLRFAELNDEYFIDTIFFGGGTPSLVKSRNIFELVNLLNKKMKFAEAPEITVEANPGTLTPAKTKDYLSFGVNRLSVGVQSFFDDDLEFLTRIHNSETAIRTVEEAYKFGFENINVDLIFNLPGQTEKRWEENLRQATVLPVKHISAYSLIVERGTILFKMIKDGKTAIGDSDYDANLYEITQSFLSGEGFIQYEVSNFARNGYECKHNLAYWRYRDYIGFGTAAHSFVNPRRWRNYSSLTFYLRSVNAKRPFIAAHENLNEKERLEEYVMLAFRSAGINVEELRELFGESFLRKNKRFIEEIIRSGYVTKKNDVLQLTPKGYALCDEILLKFEY